MRKFVRIWIFSMRKIRTLFIYSFYFRTLFIIQSEPYSLFILFIIHHSTDMHVYLYVI
jgi:hypothetical protein